MTQWPDRIMELRQYTVHAELRHRLVSIFDEHFVRGQEEHGMHVIGQFTDLDRNDRFVWLRGFDTMEQRHHALTGFYGGPVWGAHRDTANATMITSDDVLLLHPVGDWKPSPASADTDPRIVEVLLCPLSEPVSAAGFEVLRERLRSFTDGLVGILATHHAANTFTALPIRDEEHLVVVHTRAPEPSGETPSSRALASAIEAAGLPLRGLVSRLRLLPTPKSALR